VSNPQKTKGSGWERALVDFLAVHRIEATRIPAGASNDRGDLFIPIIEWPSIDAKNYSSYAGQLGGWVDRAEEQATNAGRRFGIVWLKRRGKANPANAYVVMSGKAFMTLMSMIGDK
jgi:hypothetical protein